MNTARSPVADLSEEALEALDGGSKRNFLVPAPWTHQAELSLLVLPLALLSIYSMIVPIILVDFLLWQYQVIYFGLNKIPRIERSQFFAIDRHKLSKLNWVQRLNCTYCGYGNGVVALAKAVIEQTEAYSCAIKHATPVAGREYQADFFEYDEFL